MGKHGHYNWFTREEIVGEGPILLATCLDLNARKKIVEDLAFPLMDAETLVAHLDIDEEVAISVPYPKPRERK